VLNGNGGDIGSTKKLCFVSYGADCGGTVKIRGSGPADAIDIAIASNSDLSSNSDDGRRVSKEVQSHVGIAVKFEETFLMNDD
jgi:hypothetical protein